MKQIIILLVIVLIHIGCKKSSENHPTPTPINKDSILAAKYTPLMAGNRVWHRYMTFYVFNPLNDSLINLSDTTAALTIYGIGVVSFPLLYNGGGVELTSADSNMLYFYGADYLGYGPHWPVDELSVYYFPANDSISMLEAKGEPYPTVYGYHTL